MVNESTRNALTLERFPPLILNPDWTDGDVWLCIVRGLPRALHPLDAPIRRAILTDAPSLTHTPWDALLAATAEHIAARCGDPFPPWTDEPERFVDPPWFARPILPLLRWEALCYAPAAFIRHGTPVHPSNFDERGGDRRWDPAFLLKACSRAHDIDVRSEDPRITSGPTR